MKNILHCFCFFALFILNRHCMKGSLRTRSRSFLKLMSCYLNKVILRDINALLWHEWKFKKWLKYHWLQIMYPQNLAQKSISIWFLLELHNLMTYYLKQYCPIWYLIFNILLQNKPCINCGMYFLIIFNKHTKGKNFSLCFYGKKNKLLWQNFMSRIFSVNNLLLWCKSLIVLLRRTVSHKWLMETMRPPSGVQTPEKSIHVLEPCP